MRSRLLLFLLGATAALAAEPLDRGAELAEVAVQGGIDFRLVEAVDENGVTRLRVRLAGAQVMAQAGETQLLEAAPGRRPFIRADSLPQLGPAVRVGLQRAETGLAQPQLLVEALVLQRPRPALRLVDV